MLDEQGWLYNQYFNLFRQEHNSLTGVTLWGMADDDTWLDSFPVTARIIRCRSTWDCRPSPRYWGIVNPDGNGDPGLWAEVRSHRCEWLADCADLDHHRNQW